MLAVGPAMKLNLKSVLLFALAAAFLCSSCARVPDPKRSAALIKKHFKKYAKKYPTTIFGKNGVKEVEITSEKEIHKNLISVEAFITLSDNQVQRINATIERGPMGWKFISWENATGM